MSAVLDEAARLISRMNIAEKASVLELLEREAGDTFPGIKKTPGVCGGSACIGNHRIPVWLIWSYHQSGTTDRWLLDSYPALTAEDLANAYAYARANLDEIEQEIRLDGTLDRDDAS